jgi:hypothetical protein
MWICDIFAANDSRILPNSLILISRHANVLTHPAVRPESLVANCGSHLGIGIPIFLDPVHVLASGAMPRCVVETRRTESDVYGDVFRLPTSRAIRCSVAFLIVERFPKLHRLL